ncbi:alanine racemase [Psittacicella hinzii]|uniref:alanine racemase n=1 Tax=Psittacicella hinzii TaxID=2028575 RepID=A0A3A1YFA1_9GAMM|nr:alanine racemase [Psittacicella hinzii]RIY34904.1 alanine racemase [Psittacicella hinzii]
MKYPKAVINTNAIGHNLKILKSIEPFAKIIVNVQANAYGHGLVEFSRNLVGRADAIGLTRLDEAEIIRDAGINTDIVLLEGFVNVVELFKINDLHLSPVINSYEQIQLLEQYHEHLSAINLWVKVNSEKSNLGFAQNELESVIQRLIRINGIGSISVLSDYPTNSNPNKVDLHRFITKNVVKTIHNFTYSSTTTWIKPDSAVYGVNPDHCDLSSLGLVPVMNLETVLVQVHKRQKGDKIGYGSIYTVENDTYVGVVAMGYGDGFPRNAKVNTPVLVNGRIVPLVGRVSMDMLTVDLGPVLQDHPGDKVYIFGDKQPVEQVAHHLGIKNLTLPALLTERVKHEFN